MASPNPLVTEGSTLNCILSRRLALKQKNNSSPAINGATDQSISVAFTGCVVLTPKAPESGAAKQQLLPVIGSLAGLGDRSRGVSALYDEWTFGGINNSTFPHQDERNSLTTDELIAQITGKCSAHVFQPWHLGTPLEWYIPEDNDDTRTRQKKNLKNGVPDGTYWAELRPVDQWARYPNQAVVKRILDKIESGEDDGMYVRETTAFLLVNDIMRGIIADARTDRDDAARLTEYMSFNPNNPRGQRMMMMYAAMEEMTKPASERFVGYGAGPGNPGFFGDILLAPASMRRFQQ